MNLLEEAFATGILLSALTYGTMKVVWMNLKEGVIDENEQKKTLLQTGKVNSYKEILVYRLRRLCSLIIAQNKQIRRKKHEI